MQDLLVVYIISMAVLAYIVFTIIYMVMYLHRGGAAIDRNNGRLVTLFNGDVLLPVAAVVITLSIASLIFAAVPASQSFILEVAQVVGTVVGYFILRRKLNQQMGPPR